MLISYFEKNKYFFATDGATKNKYSINNISFGSVTIGDHVTMGWTIEVVYGNSIETIKLPLDSLLAFIFDIKENKV